MSYMKRVLEVIEADEELNAVYVHLLAERRPDDESTAVLEWLYDEALAELEN